MKTASPGLIAHLSGNRQFRRGELWTFTLATGQIARYTPLDATVTVGGNTWAAGGPVLERDRSRQIAGVQVDDFTVTVHPRSTDMLAGLPWIQAARRGLLRNGRLLIERVYFPTWGDVSLGKLYHMGGRIADLKGTGARAILTIRSDLELLNTNLPSDVVQPSCLHTLFDAQCTLVKAAFDVAGAVGVGSTAASINSALAQPADYFSLGRIQFTSGANAGATRAVKKFAGGAFTLAVPLFSAIAPGDTFIASPGCDKTQPTCTNKFGNLANFGGLPYVPRPETAL